MKSTLSRSSTPFIPRRTSRRQLLIISACCLLILAANYIRSLMSGGHTTNITFKTFIEPITVLRTSTVGARPTQGSDSDRPVSRIDAGQRKAYEKVKWQDYEAALKAHRYNPNGLLEVNPEGSHPIFDLIEKSQAAWQAKLKKASRSLSEAVIEYERRYGRAPPLGFDKWWQFVEDNNVQLPDEYDQIHKDLEAFWGIDPQDLQAVVQAQEDVNSPNYDVYTIGKVNVDDPIDLLSYSLPNNATADHDLAEGGKMIIDLLRKANVEQFIPPFRATFSPYDNPEKTTDWELWNKAVDHARRGKTFSMLESPVEPKHHGWLSACDPVSPAWTTPLDFNAPYPSHLRPGSDPMSPTHVRTFIHDHAATMNPCQHPYLLRQHGQFVKYFQGPTPEQTIAPFFSFSPTMLHHDITSAMPLEWLHDIDRAADPAWEEKTDERLHWRGSNTGIYHSNDYNWKLSHRTRMMEWSQHDMYSNLRILGLGSKKGERVGEGKVVSKARWAPAMLDVAFGGTPQNCKEEEGVCDKLSTMFEFKNKVNMMEAGKFKYILDVDGNAWSARFKRIITTSSCIFKSTVYPEWFADRIQPWVHYVPVQVDLSDLWDSFAFFRGELNGENGHDDLAKKIGADGREWSLNFWREQDLTAYNFRLMLEYARVMSTDREAMSYKHWD